jgi:hypothetical protein
MVVLTGSAGAVLPGGGRRRGAVNIFRTGILRDGIRVAVICTLGLHFRPRATWTHEVWREFVVGENAGTWNNARGYFKTGLAE